MFHSNCGKKTRSSLFRIAPHHKWALFKKRIPATPKDAIIHHHRPFLPYTPIFIPPPPFKAKEEQKKQRTNEGINTLHYSY